MKNEFLIFLISIIFVLGFSFLMYNYQNENSSITGFVSLNDTIVSEIENISNFNEDIILNATEKDAIEAIKEAEKIILEMKEFNNEFVAKKEGLVLTDVSLGPANEVVLILSVLFVNDALVLDLFSFAFPSFFGAVIIAQDWQ